MTFDPQVSGGKIEGKNQWVYNYNIIIGDLAHQYLMRFMSTETELLLFGCGLGDQAAITMIGDSFLTYIDKHGDPELGRIVITCGIGKTAFMPWRGDVNLHWAWTASDEKYWVKGYLDKTLVKPDYFLCPSHSVLQAVEELGYEGLYLPEGVGRFFFPLNLKREGFGYCGLDSKGSEMRNAVLGPFLNRSDFEWISKERAKGYLSLEELNIWHNSKKVVFGMCFDHSEKWGLVTGRVFITLASGTPLLHFKHRGIEPTLGFKYPYQTSSREETEQLVEDMLTNYDETLTRFQEYSVIVRKEHHYLRRIEKLMAFLKAKT